jgi:hypothetical protein
MSNLGLAMTALLSLSAVLAACSSDNNAPPAAAVVATATESGPTITFKSDPDPPRAGSNDIEVNVRGTDGKPVDNITVTAQFYMPAMPAMSMPEMRNSFALEPAGSGAYRGKVQLEMSGTWNVTIIIMRDNEKIGSKKLMIVGK